MPASQWEFSAAANSGLRIGSRPSSERKTKPNRGQRQSGLAVLYIAVRRLPLCSAIAAGVVWIAARLLPEYIRWVIAAWSAGLLALALALGSAAMSWSVSRWKLTDRRLVLTFGLLSRTEVTIHRSAILSAELETTPFTAIFRCSRLYIRTAQRGERRPDRLLMSTRDGIILSGQLMPSGGTQVADNLHAAEDIPDECSLSAHHHTFRADRRSLLLAAVGGEGLAAFCSAAASVLSLVRDSVGTELGEQVSRLIYTRGITIAAISTLAAAWLLKVGHTLLTHANMSFTISGRLLMLSRGVISRRSFRLRTEGICALDRRLSLPSAFFGRESSSLLTAGGRRYDLLPPVSRRRSRIESAVIMPRGERVCVVSPTLSPLVYAWGRWAACLAVFPLTSILRRLVPSWTSTILAVGVTVGILLLWRALTTTVCARRAGIALYTDCVELTGVRLLTVHTLRVFRPSAGMIRITQSPFGRAFGRCTVRMIPRGGSAGTSLSCIKLPFERAMAVCERVM